MRGLKTMKVFSLVAIMIVIGLFGANNKVEGGMQPEKVIIEEPISIGDPVSEWKTYHNEEWGYSVEYPPAWSTKITLKNENKPEYVIRNRVSFFSPEYVEIAIDVWTNPSNLDLAEWFRKNRKWAVNSDAETNQCTSTALELLAICASEPWSCHAPGELKCIFGKNDLIYRVRYINSDDNQSEWVYRHILSTFEFK